MEQQKLPNATLVLVMGILSIIGCCCGGLPGIVFGIIAIIKGKKDKALYAENPELYTNIGNLNAGYIMGIIGLVLSLISAIRIAYVISTGEIDEAMEIFREAMENAQQNQ